MEQRGARWGWFVLWSMMGLGCSSAGAVKVVRDRASWEFRCPKKSIRVQNIGGRCSFVARGCNREASYLVKAPEGGVTCCPPMGCDAVRNSEVRGAAPKLTVLKEKRGRRRAAVDPQAPLPKSLSNQQVLEVLASHKDSINDCRRRGRARPGKMTVSALIKRDGSTTDVAIAPPELQDSMIGQCVLLEVEVWRFPRFSGAPIPIDFPIALSRPAP